MAWASGFIAGGAALILLQATLGVVDGVGWWGLCGFLLAVFTTAADHRD